MINKPSPFKGLNIRIPILIPTKGRGFIDLGSTLGCLRLPEKRRECAHNNLEVILGRTLIIHTAPGSSPRSLSSP